MEVFRREVRWSKKLFQSVAWKLHVGHGTFWVRGMSRIVRMGRCSVLGPCGPGSVSHLIIKSEVWLEHQTLSSLVQLPVESV